MANYVLSSAADQSLEDIYIYTHDQHGPAQAEAYHEAFHRIFGLLADFPYLGRSADELRPGLRQYPQGSHVVFYSVREDIVHIEQILVVSQVFFLGRFSSAFSLRSTSTNTRYATAQIETVGHQTII